MGAESFVAYEFGRYRLIPADKRLLCGGVPVQLTPKAFDILSLLIENRGFLVEKDVLLKTLWPGTFVGEVTLAHNISLLRKALRDHGGYIETVPKRGYRFVEPVREVRIRPSGRSNGDEASHEVPLQSSWPSTTSGPTRSWANVVAIALAVLIVVGFVGFRWFRAPAVLRGSTSVAIVPFATAATDQSIEHLGSGLADALVVRLHRLPRILVHPVSAVASFDPRTQDPVAFARVLRVDTVLAGAIQRDGDRLRVTARLTRVSDGTVLWAESIDQRASDLLSIEDAISARLVESLAPSLTRDEHSAVNSGTTVAAAHEAYLRGRYLWTRRSLDDIRKAADSLEEAVRLDPKYALAYAGLADAYMFMGGYVERTIDPMVPRARQAAARAIALDPTLAQPHATLALMAMNVDLDWAAADLEFQTALALDPRNPTARAWYGEYLAYMGRFDEGIAELRRASEIDPLSPVIRTDIAKALTLARRYPDALRQLDAVSLSDPTFKRTEEYRASALYLAGRYDDALAALGRTNPSADDPSYLSGLVQIHGHAGRAVEARDALARLVGLSKRTRVLPVTLALAYGAVGDLDAGFRMIDRMCDGFVAGVVGFKVDPAWDDFRRDPRFEQALERARFTSGTH